MKAKRDPLGFDPKDWGQFDFSRWHLDGLPLEGTAAAFADLVRRLFDAPEWRQNFRATLPELQAEALNLYRAHNRALEAEAVALAKDFEERTARVRRQAAALRERIQAAGAPPRVQADPEGFPTA